MKQGFSISESGEHGLPDNTADFLTKPLFHLLLIFCAILCAYLHTLNVPFYFDDYPSIRDNPAIRDLGALGDIWQFSPARFITYLSFSFNYLLGGYDVSGYHLLNILIHTLTSFTVYGLCHSLLRTPAIADSYSANIHQQNLQWLPLLVAILFALHPLQTQAVTYIVQRAASLTALFYLGSLFFYLKARLSHDSRQQVFLFCAALVAALLSLLTKQNSITLPAAVFLLEVCILKPPRRTLVFILSGITLLLFVCILCFEFILGRNFLEFLSNETIETTTVSRGEYFTIQMQVIWTYILKFFYPLTLYLDYDLAVPDSLLGAGTVLAALMHCAVLVAGIVLTKRSPLAGFAILFYYLTLSVESSIIPIRDFGFEHRTYLPNFGLCLLVGWVVFSILARKLAAKHILVCCVLVSLGLAFLTWNRNNLWRDPIAFYQHEIAVNPGNFRAYSMLGENYLRESSFQQALATYRRAEPLYDSYISKETNTELAFYSNFVLTLDETGNHQEAIELIESLDLESMSAEPRSLLLARRGIIYAKNNQLEAAEADFISALDFDAANVDALTNYATLLLVTGRPGLSEEYFSRAYELDPANQAAINGMDYFENL